MSDIKARLDGIRSEIKRRNIKEFTVEQTIEFAQLINVDVDEDKIKSKQVVLSLLDRLSHSIAGILRMTGANVGQAEYLRQALIKLKQKAIMPARRRFLEKSPSTRPHDVSLWSTEVTCKWLTDVGLGELQTFFENNDIDGQVLLTINFAELFDVEPLLEAHFDRLNVEIEILRDKG
jgi:hypothetical protein